MFADHFIRIHNMMRGIENGLRNFSAYQPAGLVLPTSKIVRTSSAVGCWSPLILIHRFLPTEMIHVQYPGEYRPHANQHPLLQDIYFGLY